MLSDIHPDQILQEIKKTFKNNLQADFLKIYNQETAEHPLQDGFSVQNIKLKHVDQEHELSELNSLLKKDFPVLKWDPLIFMKDNWLPFKKEPFQSLLFQNEASIWLYSNHEHQTELKKAYFLNSQKLLSLQKESTNFVMDWVSFQKNQSLVTALTRFFKLLKNQNMKSQKYTVLLGIDSDTLNAVPLVYAFRYFFKTLFPQAEFYFVALPLTHEYTLGDVHNNLIRQTLQIYNAILSGCDSILSIPFQWWDTKNLFQSLHNSHNIQFLLADEVKLMNAANPIVGNIQILKAIDQYYDLMTQIWQSDKVEEIPNTQKSIIGYHLYPQTEFLNTFEFHNEVENYKPFYAALPLGFKAR